MDLIVIEGWGGSGKSLALSYLDSHPEIYAMPVHDKTHYSLLNLNPQRLKLEYHDLREIRRVLDSHGYYNIEYNSIRGVIPVLLSTKKDDILPIPFVHNFEKFEEGWKRDLLNTQSNAPSNILKAIYKSFIRQTGHKDSVNAESFTKVATLGDAKSKDPVDVLENYAFSKIIYVKRSIPDLIGIRANRVTPAGLSAGMFEKEFFDLILSGEIQKILKYEYQLEAISEDLSNRILIVEFDDLIINKKSVFHSITNFLKCRNFEMYPSMLGYEIGREDDNYGTSKTDSGIELLSSVQLRIVKVLEYIGRLSYATNVFIYMSLRVIHFIYRGKNWFKRRWSRG